MGAASSPPPGANARSAREQWDRHNRDEAAARDAQQEAAGPDHSPVRAEPYASSAMQPGAADACMDAVRLAAEYERAAAAERVAWLRARSALGQAGGAREWSEWRDAVERTHSAALGLVNYGNARSP